MHARNVLDKGSEFETGHVEGVGVKVGWMLGRGSVRVIVEEYDSAGRPLNFER